MRTDVSRSLRNSPQFAGVSAGSNADVRSLPLAEVAIASILAAGLWGSANPFLARDGVAHEDCEVQIDKPSTILAAGLWALQTRSWRRPELHMKTAKIKSTNRASRIGATTRPEHRADA